VCLHAWCLYCLACLPFTPTPWPQLVLLATGPSADLPMTCLLISATHPSPPAVAGTSQHCCRPCPRQRPGAVQGLCRGRPSTAAAGGAGRQADQQGVLCTGRWHLLLLL
jgi:hypothetical protein